MKDMKAIKMVVIYLIVVWPIMLACFLSMMAGNISVSYNGFAIDSSDNLYIGKQTKIEKYYEGELIDTISPHSSRTYAFTIQDDEIILSNTSAVYTLDLDGNVISKHEDFDAKTYDSLQYKKEFTAANGKTYFLKSSFGRKQIVSENGDILYKMPVKDYVAKLLLIAVGIFSFIYIPIAVYKTRKMGAFR